MRAPSVSISPGHRPSLAITSVFPRGPGGGIYLKIFCGPDPLRTLRGRKIPGEDKKSTKHLLSELWSKRTGAEGRRALLALRRGCPEVSVTPALCLALCLCPRRHLSPPPPPPGCWEMVSLIIVQLASVPPPSLPVLCGATHARRGFLWGPASVCAVTCSWGRGAGRPGPPCARWLGERQVPVCLPRAAWSVSGWQCSGPWQALLCLSRLGIVTHLGFQKQLLLMEAFGHSRPLPCTMGSPCVL